MTEPGRYAEWARPDTAAEPERLTGQVLEAEGRLLRARARDVPSGQCIVEIGSYTGKSTCCLALGSAEGNRVPVYAVDMWETGTSHKGSHFRRYDPAVDAKQSGCKFHDPGVRRKFNGRIQQYDKAGVIVPVMVESKDAAAACPSPPIGLLFIDAEHRYEAVRADLEAWMPRLASQAVVLFHDYKQPGADVHRYVNELIARNGGCWALEIVVGTLALCQWRRKEAGTIHDWP